MLNSLEARRPPYSLCVTLVACSLVVYCAVPSFSETKSRRWFCAHIDRHNAAATTAARRPFPLPMTPAPRASDRLSAAQVSWFLCCWIQWRLMLPYICAMPPAVAITVSYMLSWCATVAAAEEDLWRQYRHLMLLYSPPLCRGSPFRCHWCSFSLRLVPRRSPYPHLRFSGYWFDSEPTFHQDEVLGFFPYVVTGAWGGSLQHNCPELVPATAAKCPRRPSCCHTRPPRKLFRLRGH